MKRKFFIILIALFTSISLYAQIDFKQEIENLENIKRNLTTYDFYEHELNRNTVESSSETRETFDEYWLSYTKRENFYCEQIFLDELKGKTFAMMQISGSGLFTYLTI